MHYGASSVGIQSKFHNTLIRCVPREYTTGKYSVVLTSCLLVRMLVRLTTMKHKSNSTVVTVKTSATFIMNYMNEWYPSICLHVVMYLPSPVGGLLSHSAGREGVQEYFRVNG